MELSSSRTIPTGNRVKQILQMCAQTLYRSKNALGSYYRRKRAQLGAPKAITAAAHKMARSLYWMLAKKESYREMGENYYETQYRERTLRKLKEKAKELGLNLLPAT
jgi:hypothetical protein